MKKFVSKVASVFTVVLILSAFVSCQYDIEAKNTIDDYDYIQFEYDGYLEEAEKERKQQLINLAKIGGWQSEYKNIETTLENIFAPEIKNRLGLSSNITVMEEQTYFIPVNPLANHNRSSKVDECTQFEFRLYSMTSGDFKGYALTSPDKRVGNIIAIVESEYQEDISDCNFAIDYMQRLELYIQHTADLWNAITDEDLGEYDNIQNTNIAFSVRTPPIIIEQPDYEFTNWEKHDGNDTIILKTKWNQNPAPFNSCVKAIKDSSIKYAGCVTVQVGQLMTFHKYPENLSSPYLSVIKEKWNLASDWDGKYDWELITKIINSYTSYSRIQHVHIGSLLYDIAVGCNAEFKADSTGISDSDRNNYLKSKGYTYDSTSNYSLDKIKVSINAGYPVPVNGYAEKKVEKKSFLCFKWDVVSYEEGHAFVVDGYYNMSCKVTKKGETTSLEITEDFVHCNVGWNGEQNGYYLSGVFAMDEKRGALLKDRSAQPEWSDYYQYRLRQLNMLRPTR